MPYVRDRSGNNPAAVDNAGNVGFGLERPYCMFNRTNAGSPNTVGPLTPLYAGERVWDSTGFQMYEAATTATTTWQVVVDNEHTGA